MANPRKFSEKIALHTQKQAEETAAFEAIMREVSGVSRVAYQKHHLQLSQNLGAYRGGSLPNVNQIGTNSIDLQNALHNLEDMKQGRQSLVDRMHRDRNRQVGHRRPFPFDKRVDCSPYGSAYLSPPPDSSWRRTSSDSALHTSAMATVTDNTHGQNTPPTQRRAMEVMGDNHLQADGMQRGVYWDPKKLAQSRPKSCEVPNINIYPSQEQDSGVHIPISSNTGSLPDLTNLHFPSPLATPLDVEDQSYSQGSPANLSPTSAHHMGMGVPPGSSQPQQQSPVARRRHPHGGPSPLVLTGGSNQMRLPLSPPDANVDPSQLLSDPRIQQQYMLYLQQQQRLQQQRQQQQQQQQHHHPRHPSSHHHSNSSNSPPSIPHHQVPQIHISCPQTQADTQPSMTQYRNSTSDTTCQSPTSPLSQPSYSPAQSPGLPPSTVNNSPFADAYYLQQQQQQTNSLQHQFEQFSMLQDSQPICTAPNQISKSMVNNGGMYISGQPTTANVTQAGLNQVIGDYGQQRYYDNNQHSPHQQNSQQHHSQLSPSPNTNNKIPDIIFTGADDPLARQDFAKELGNAITGMPDSFDTDFFPSDEALKVGLDPLDLDGLQMLTDPNMVADPATEDTFRLDRL